jgi:hypothetical protein
LHHLGRKEVGTTRTDELFMFCAMLNKQPVNTCYYLFNYLVSIAKKKPDAKSEIVVGGIITFIARKMGVGEENGITRIEGKNRLDLDTLTTMFFIRHYGPTHNYQYEWKVNRAHCLIILPNPTITNPGLVENLLYVGTNPQVQDDGDDGDDEDEGGAHLHDDLVHHDPEVSGQNDNDRWTWMQNEIQRISTEQQRQGVEISGLRGDVQRGNRMHEQNNCMLLRMMQHLNL